MKQKPKVTKREIVAHTNIFRIEAMQLEFSNGATRQYERIVGSPQGAVLVVGLLPGPQVLLVEEYAAGIERYELAFPKGKIDAGEDVLTAANRELQEETGYAAGKLTHIESMTIAPGYLGHTTHIVLAEELYPSSLDGDEPEPLQVIRWDLDDHKNLVQREDFTEARSIAALYRVMEIVKQQDC
ncbi:MAG: ADP compounds hydrolase NudE [Chromatiales bacterium]